MYILWSLILPFVLRYFYTGVSCVLISAIKDISLLRVTRLYLCYLLVIIYYSRYLGVISINIKGRITIIVSICSVKNKNTYTIRTGNHTGLLTLLLMITMEEILTLQVGVVIHNKRYNTEYL